MWRPDLGPVGRLLDDVTPTYCDSLSAPRMPQPDKRRPRLHDADAEYSYRRPLRLREVLPAIGIGIGAGLFAFYVTRLMLQRTPLRVSRHQSQAPRREPKTGA